MRAQEIAVDSLAAGEIEKIRALWKTVAEQKVSISQESFDIKFFQNTSIPSGASTSPIVNLNNVKSELLKRDIGLQANGGFIENLDPGFADLEENLSYRRRFQAGLDWDILRNGLVDNRTKSEILLIENKLEGIKSGYNQKQDFLLEKYYNTRSVFNLHKRFVLQKRLAVIREELPLTENLFFYKYLSRESYLGLLARKSDVEAMSQVYQELPSPFNDLKETALPPVVDINVQEILEYINYASRKDSTIAFSQNIYKLEQNKWNAVSLRTSLKYNYYDISQTSNNRSFLSLGVGLSVPIPMNFKSSGKLNDAKVKVLEESENKKMKARQEETHAFIYDYKYKLKQYQNFKEKQKLYEELLRKERVKEKIDSANFNPIRALEVYDESLKILIEMLDLQQQMNLMLLSFSAKVNMDIGRIVKAYEEPFQDSVNNNTRSIYIWSKAINNYSADFIVEYLKYNQINSAIVAVKSGYKNKVLPVILIKKLAKFDIETEILVGNNDLTDQNIEQYLDSVVFSIPDELLKAVHLDVEPHTQDDWKEKQEKYLKDYIKMLEKAKIFCDKRGMKLNVSIPLHYPVEALNDIYALANEVYIMAYENTSPGFVERKINEELERGRKKTIIALRAKDFETRAGMEAYVSSLKNNIRINKFCYHDLETMLKLDGEVINKEQE